MTIFQRSPTRNRVNGLLLFVVLASVPVGVAVADELPALDCVIQPYRVVDLASSVSGVLDKVYVDKSDFIEQGEIAATLKAGVERASVVLATARAGIDSEVQVNSVNLDFDQRRKKRMVALYEKKSISIDVKDAADREQNLSKWRLQQARDLKNIRHLELLRAQAQLEEKTIRTPIAGFVVQRFKEAGEYVEEQPIMRIAQLDPLYVEAIVPIEFHGQVEAGMIGKVYPDISKQQYHEAEVTVIDRVGHAASGTFGVRLVLPNPENRVLAGSKCMMKFSSTARSASTKGDARQTTAAANVSQ